MQLCTLLCGVFQLSAVIQSATIKQDTGVLSVGVGDDVILHCFYDSQVSMHFSWYQQTLGNGPELLFTIYKYNDPSKVFHWLKNPRFSVMMRMDGTNHLRISNVQLGDSATYLCGSSHSNMVEFGEGVFLSVKGAGLQEIVQGPVSETIQRGGSMTFNCTVVTGTCNEEQSVYWFRHGYQQGIFYTQGDHCRSVSKAGSASQSCVYHLQKMNLSFSDAGTYYCAVASCGEILFGNGSKLLISDDDEAKMAQMRIFLWLSVIRAGILLFFLMVCLLFYMFKSRRP